MDKGQALRPSQFIMVYGVGSIIESPNGPRVIPVFYRWGDRLRQRLSDPGFVIEENSISALLDGAKIFKIPTNSDYDDVTDSEILFQTIRFPMWALCLKHRKLYRLDTEDQTMCTECPRMINPHGANYRHEAIRFIRACPKGHMDDIRWDEILHHGSGCKNKVFDWHGGQISLEHVEIICPQCSSKCTLRDIYNDASRCSKYFPEKKEYDSRDCDEKMQVMLRSQSSLRMPSLLTVITIPPRDSNAYLMISGMNLRSRLEDHPYKYWTKQKLLERLRSINENNQQAITRTQIDRMEEFEESEISDAISQIMNVESNQIQMDDVMKQELDALKRGASEGAPSVSMRGKTQFEMNREDVREIKMNLGSLRIAPVQKLRVVMVQKGYTRTSTDTENANVVKTYLKVNEEIWFPGLEMRGEGLFLDLPANPEIEFGEEGKIWLDRFKKNPETYKKFHPMFIWWHTLSHAIINMLSVDSGYSAASIRERIYFFYDSERKNIHSGILLYTSQPSGDGTLGGLVGIANNFQRMIDRALERAQNCSNDPLCSAQLLEKERSNGAACYACLLLSETSCENSNLLLDRNLIKGTQ